jgi:hypothetical protein
MELPPCPLCGQGHLLPLSEPDNPFSLWVCSAPSCAYAVSKDAAGDVYYKGVAASEAKQKGDKEWTEFRF